MSNHCLYKGCLTLVQYDKVTSLTLYNYVVMLVVVLHCAGQPFTVPGSMIQNP